MSSPSGIIETPVYLLWQERPNSNFLKFLGATSGLETAQSDILERQQNDSPRSYLASTSSGIVGPAGVAGSGITEDDATNIAFQQSVLTLASGTLNTIRLLPPLGHYHNSSELIVNDLFPAVEFPNGDDKFLSWNLLIPTVVDKNTAVIAQSVASGMHVFFQWSPLITDTGTVRWRVEITPTPPDANLDSVIATEKDLLLPSQTYTAKDIELSVISVSGIDLSTAVQLRLRRVGSQDSFGQTVYTFNEGVSYF